MFDIHDFMRELATKRPIFHSEADFQHAFAWQFHEQNPNAGIRLEYPIRADDKWIYVDIWTSVNNVKIAFELKYKTRKFVTQHSEENFKLKDHGAQDLGKYDFIKDVMRLEHVKSMTESKGYAILLSNDKQYWAIGGNEAFARNFRLHDARHLNGSLGWHGTPSSGTTKNREKILDLSGNYLCEWTHYSWVSEKEFRYLALRI